jgi:hypothetical protein
MGAAGAADASVAAGAAAAGCSSAAHAHPDPSRQAANIVKIGLRNILTPLLLQLKYVDSYVFPAAMLHRTVSYD